MNSQQQVIQGTFSDVSELHVSKLRTIAFKLSSSLQGAAGFTKRPPHQSCSRPPLSPCWSTSRGRKAVRGGFPGTTNLPGWGSWSRVLGDLWVEFMMSMNTHGENQLSLVPQSCLTVCDPMDCSTPGLPVCHQLPEFTQTHFHQVGDIIQPSHPLSSPSPPALNLSQHQGLF